MRNIQNCRLFFPNILPTLPCSYPDEDKCGSYMKIYRRSGNKKQAITLCSHRVAELGRKGCVREQMKLKDSTIYR